MSPASTKQTRRKLHFEKIEEILADAEQAVADEYETLGQWSLGQILEHLASAFNASVDGFPFQANWFLRKLVAPLIKNSILIKPMKPGFKLPKAAAPMLPAEGIDPVAALEGLKIAISRFQEAEKFQLHPFFGKLAESEWTLLHMRHSELHLSFAVPRD